MIILGIESSCDETAAAVVENGERLFSNVVQSQIDIHAHYGGVIPEIAARSHIEAINPVIDEALAQASLGWDDIDAIAVTYAPGLIGSLLVGTLAARTLAILKNKPLYAIHHVEAHVYANFITRLGSSGVRKLGSDKTQSSLEATTDSSVEGVVGEAQPNAMGEPSAPHKVSPETDEIVVAESIRNLTLPSTQPAFPMLALIVSGGHSQLVLFRDHGDYALLGQTQDDAVGEAFDKVAKILGLPYPGGPAIDNAAPLGDARKYLLPKAKLKCPVGCTHGLGNGEWEIRNRESEKGVRSLEMENDDSPKSKIQNPKSSCMHYSFSFSGLKTAVLRAVQHEVGVETSFPSYELSALLTTSQRNDFAASFQRVAVETLVDKTVLAYTNFSPKSVVIAGGVAACDELRRQLADRLPINIEYAPIKLCTDNAAMVAALGYFYAKRCKPNDPFSLEVQPSLSMSSNVWGIRKENGEII